MRALFLGLLLAAPAAAIEIEREAYAIIGWDDACTVAIERYAYPKLGQAIHNEPVMTRIGTLSVVADKPVMTTRWILEADGANTWDERRVELLRRDLKKAGYGRPGFLETIRDEVLLSTASLGARLDAWPGPEWRWSRAHYNPLTTCALLVFEKIGERDRFQFLLARVYNPRVRTDRARAHTTAGRRLFNAGDLDGALAEVEIGAGLAPELGIARYHHAAMLALSGHIEKSVRELAAAIKRDPRLADKAAKDEDFESLRSRDDFRDLIEQRP